MLSDVKEQYKRASLCSGFLSSLDRSSRELISKLYFFFNRNLMPMKEVRLAAPETRLFYLNSDMDQQEKKYKIYIYIYFSYVQK